MTQGAFFTLDLVRTLGQLLKVSTILLESHLLFFYMNQPGGGETHSALSAYHS